MHCIKQCKLDKETRVCVSCHRHIDEIKQAGLKKKRCGMYLVTTLEKRRELSVGQAIVKLEMNWANGMIGCFPVFDTYEQAETYAGDSGAQILQLGLLDEG